jgi:hypothetical protein|tara:strand:+ start:530 stop:1225 length:696 start_codon:yes stop_codon:yes gene_type:complete
VFDAATGKFEWAVDQAGYEIVPLDADSTPPNLSARFYRSEIEENWLLARGAIRRKGGSDKKYRPMTDAPGLARQFAASFTTGSPGSGPADAELLRLAGTFGLLGDRDVEPIRDWVYLTKYLSGFAEAIDRGDWLTARTIFNSHVTPPMTVRLVGATGGRITANWSMSVAPIDLVGAAWLQIAAELTAGAGMRKCDAPDCPEWFPFRANKRFCNDRCKSSFHRHTKSENKDE